MAWTQHRSAEYLSQHGSISALRLAGRAACHNFPAWIPVPFQFLLNVMFQLCGKCVSIELCQMPNPSFERLGFDRLKVHLHRFVSCSVDDPSEQKRVKKWFIPSEISRSYLKATNARSSPSSDNAVAIVEREDWIEPIGFYLLQQLELDDRVVTEIRRSAHV